MEQKFIYLPDKDLLIDIAEIKYCIGNKIYLKESKDVFFQISQADFKILLFELTNGKCKC